jgi:septal ring factor EnvC (AmiA/AmiB activator)
MSENMPAHSEREAPDDLFRNVEEALKQLRAAATPPPAPPESWWTRTFNPAPPSSHQSEFNTALVSALTQLSDGLRQTAASQQTRLAEIAAQVQQLQALPESLDAFREHSVRVEGELRLVAANVRGLQERSAALEAELAQARDEQGEKVRQLAGEQRDLARDLSERIQHLLDEQRVCIRQLSLQASEEAVLADRARRATELKLEELARRVPPPPA